jgi:hypothetical protein
MAKGREVLRVYREVLKLARSWEAAEADQTATERAYIREEAMRLFRKNQHVGRHHKAWPSEHSLTNEGQYVNVVPKKAFECHIFQVARGTVLQEYFTRSGRCWHMRTCPLTSA